MASHQKSASASRDDYKTTHQHFSDTAYRFFSCRTSNEYYDTYDLRNPYIQKCLNEYQEAARRLVEQLLETKYSSSELEDDFKMLSLESHTESVSIIFDEALKKLY